MISRIAIVGAGAIGARHLQALTRLDRNLEVDVVDPSEAARDRAAVLLADAGGLQAGKINYHADASRIARPDLAIVATNARERPSAIIDLLGLGARSLILEKVLFTTLPEYDRIGLLLSENNCPTWVNCVRRAYPRARDLVDRIDGRPFHYRVEGSGWGLACNVIHHLDEFAMLSGSDDIALNGLGLGAETLPATRKRYIELNGTLTGSINNHWHFSASCLSGERGDRVVTITCDGFELRVSQLKQAVLISDQAGTRVEPFPIPLQSEVTAHHVDAILEGKKPALPEYTTAARVHCTMLQTFIDHLRRTCGDASIDECPIT